MTLRVKTSICPSNFGKNISYKKICPEIESLIKTEYISLQDGIEFKVLVNPAKKIERHICDFFKNIESMDVAKALMEEVEINKYIQGLSLRKLYKFISDLNPSYNLCKTGHNIKIQDFDSVCEADLIVNSSLIDVKSYMKFGKTLMINAFLQLLIYYHYLKKDHKIEYIGIFVPVKSQFHYIVTKDIDLIEEKIYSEYKKLKESSKVYDNKYEEMKKEIFELKNKCNKLNEENMKLIEKNRQKDKCCIIL